VGLAKTRVLLLTQNSKTDGALRVQTLTEFLRKVKHNAFNSFAKSYMFLCNKLHRVNQKKVVLKSFGGKSYSDNPKAISEKLHEMHPEAEIVWILKEPEKKKSIVPDYVRMVKANTLKEIKELATAKVWVDNFCKPLWTYKSREQFYIQTWHGDRGFKKILHDSSFVTKHYRLIESRICDLAVSGSEYGDRKYRTAFRFEGRIIRCGCPRNDRLIVANSERKEMLKKELGITYEIKVLVYAPTLRREAARDGTLQSSNGIDLSEILDKLNSCTEQDWTCVVRSHSSVRGIDGISFDDHRIIDGNGLEDMNELLAIADFLITDYSSSAGDFVLLNRPVVLFQPDVEEYVAKDRSFYFDIDNSPYIRAKSQDELLSIIEGIDWGSMTALCKSIMEFYGTNETGEASTTVANEIIDVLSNRISRRGDE